MSSTIITKDTMQRYEDGDHITNLELSALIEVYARVLDGCSTLGPRFYLAKSVAARDLYNLRSFALARGLESAW